MSIHPSSVISKEVELDSDVTIGPFCYIQGKVRIGAGTVLESHVSVGSPYGIVEIGKNNRIGANAAVGGPPQDLKYNGEPTKLIIGDNNIIREMATLNTGTVGGGGVTKVGNHCLIMAYTHIAHDCMLGDHIVMANSAQLAGHVIVEDHVKISGMSGVTQFVRVGRHAFVAGLSAVNKDILPFTIAQGIFASSRATNRIGMERAGYTAEEIESVNRAVRILTKGGETVEKSLQRIGQECASTPALEVFLNFVRSSTRGLAIL